MTIRTYRRRSKNDEGKQQFSLDVQSKGCDEHIERMGFAAEERVDYVDDGRAGDDFLGRTGLRQLLADATRGSSARPMRAMCSSQPLAWTSRLNCCLPSSFLDRRRYVRMVMGACAA